jgi:hypothetical protein
VINAGLLQHGEQQPENDVVRIVIGECLLENLGEKGEGGSPGIVDRLGQGRVENVERVEAHQLMAGLFDIVGTDVSHRFERATEAPPRPCRRLGNTLDLAVVPGEKRNELVGLVDGPGAEDNGFGLVSDHGWLGSAPTEARQTIPSARDWKNSRGPVGK